MKATREQVLAMAEEAGFLSHQLSAYEVKLDALVHLAQQFTLDQLRADGAVCRVAGIPVHFVPETLE